MNKLRLIIVLAFFVSLLNFTSCENEPIDPAIDLNPVVLTCAAPITFTVSDFINSNSVTLNWTSSGEEDLWEIQYGIEGFVLGNGTSITSIIKTKTITGLTTTNNYQFYIRTVCGNDSYSSWIGPVDVGSNASTCSNPANLTAVRSATDATQVTVNWLVSGNENSWEVQYGTAGFAIGSGTTVNSSNSSKIVTGLLGNTAYHFYVRAKCSATDFSEWVGPINVNSLTQNNGIAGTYKLTAFNTSVPTDLNGDGTTTTNQLSETICYNNFLLTLNANNTFVSNSKGVDISNSIIICYVDPDENGTWSLTGSELTLSYTNPVDTETYIVNGNTLTATLLNEDIVGTELGTGTPVYLNSNVTIIFTKQ